MAIEILRPNAPGDLTQVHHQKPASGQHWDKVDEAVVDYSTTKIYTKYVAGSDPPKPYKP